MGRLVWDGLAGLCILFFLAGLLTLAVELVVGLYRRVRGPDDGPSREPWDVL